MRDRVLWIARSAAGTSKVPGDPRSLRSFVAGPLRKAISDLTDSGVATALVETLAPILAMAQRSYQTSAVRARVQPEPVELPSVPDTEAPSRPSLTLVSEFDIEIESEPPSTSTIPVTGFRQVLLTTSDPSRATILSDQIGSAGQLIVMEDAMGLLLEIEGESHIDLIIVDCISPSVQPATMLTLSDDLDPRTRVLLWGASPELGNELTALSVKANSWLRAPTAMSPNRVGELLLHLLQAD